MARLAFQAGLIYQSAPSVLKRIVFGPFTRKVSQEMAQCYDLFSTSNLSRKADQMTSADPHDQTLEQAQMELKEVEPPLIQSMQRVDDKVISGRLFDEPDELKPWKKDRSPAKCFAVLTPEALNNSKVYAKFSRRLGAHCVDWCIVNTICACVFAVIFGGQPVFVPFWVITGVITLVPGCPLLCLIWSYLVAGWSSSTGNIALFFFSLVPADACHIIIIGTFLIDASYHVIMESSFRQATLGKMLFRIHVTNTTGNQLKLGLTFLRYLAKPINLVCLIVAFVGIDWDKKQAYHDQIARTYVLNDEA